MDKQVVHTTSLFAVDDTFNDERFCRVRIAAMHSGINRNGSRFSVDCIKNAKNTFANIPILADVREYTDENGNKYLDYSGHSMHIEEDAMNEGNDRMIYDEKVVGLIPETNNFELVKDEDTGNEYVMVDALLFREYGNYCVDILEARNGQTDVSMEISCSNVSYDAKDKCLDVGEMMACACTLLGEDVKPGMAKAHATVFSSDSEDRETQLIKIMQELKESLDNYTKAFSADDNSKKGGTEVKFEELLEKYGKTLEDITFEYEGLSDEELEAAFAEAFADDDETEEESPEADGVDAGDDETTSGSDDITPEAGGTSEEDVDDDDSTKKKVVNELNEDSEGDANTFSVNDGVRNYSISLGDKISALSTLVNDTYAEIDNDYYMVDVYEEDGYVLMHGWSNSYKQAFKKKKCHSYSLVGDRVPVRVQYLTDDEISELESIRSKYSEISEKLQKYEDEPKKAEVLQSKKYGYVADTEEFVALMENHFDMSLEDVAKKADEILLSYAESGKLKFAEGNANTGNSPMRLPIVEKNANRYGNLFAK